MRKATIRFVMSVRLSVRTERIDFKWTDFHEIWNLSIFRKFVTKIKVSLKSDKNNGYFTWRRIYFLLHLVHIFLVWEMFQKKVVEKIKKHILCSVTLFFFRKSCRLWEKVEKYCRTGQVTDDNMAYAHCMLDTLGYKHSFRMYNASCFSTANMIARTRLYVTLYVGLFYLRQKHIPKNSLIYCILFCYEIGFFLKRFYYPPLYKLDRISHLWLRERRIL